MSELFKELDYQNTPLGNISLRRRKQLKLNKDIFEVILNDEHLMSNLFISSEVALATIPLNEMTSNSPDILIGGLGLGYTAREVLSILKVTVCLLSLDSKNYIARALNEKSLEYENSATVDRLSHIRQRKHA